MDGKTLASFNPLPKGKWTLASFNPLYDHNANANANANANKLHRAIMMLLKHAIPTQGLGDFTNIDLDFLLTYVEKNQPFKNDNWPELYKYIVENLERIHSDREIAENQALAFNTSRMGKTTVWWDPISKSVSGTEGKERKAELENMYKENKHQPQFLLEMLERHHWYDEVIEKVIDEASFTFQDFEQVDQWCQKVIKTHARSQAPLVLKKFESMVSKAVESYDETTFSTNGFRLVRGEITNLITLQDLNKYLASLNIVGLTSFNKLQSLQLTPGSSHTMGRLEANKTYTFNDNQVKCTDGTDDTIMLPVFCTTHPYVEDLKHLSIRVNEARTEVVVQTLGQSINGTFVQATIANVGTWQMVDPSFGYLLCHGHKIMIGSAKMTYPGSTEKTDNDCVYTLLAPDTVGIYSHVGPINSGNIERLRVLQNQLTRLEGGAPREHPKVYVLNRWRKVREGNKIMYNGELISLKGARALEKKKTKNTKT
jgi:hypothetical protein